MWLKKVMYIYIIKHKNHIKLYLYPSLHHNGRLLIRLLANRLITQNNTTPCHYNLLYRTLNMILKCQLYKAPRGNLLSFIFFFFCLFKCYTSNRDESIHISKSEKSFVHNFCFFWQMWTSCMLSACVGFLKYTTSPHPTRAMYGHVWVFLYIYHKPSSFYSKGDSPFGFHSYLGKLVLRGYECCWLHKILSLHLCMVTTFNPCVSCDSAMMAINDFTPSIT